MLRIELDCKSGHDPHFLRSLLQYLSILGALIRNIFNISNLILEERVQSPLEGLRTAIHVPYDNTLSPLLVYTRQ
jgi:hypothetical protein